MAEECTDAVVPRLHYLGHFKNIDDDDDDDDDYENTSRAAADAHKGLTT